jgi:hypothetical protein
VAIKSHCVPILKNVDDVVVFLGVLKVDIQLDVSSGNLAMIDSAGEGDHPAGEASKAARQCATEIERIAQKLADRKPNKMSVDYLERQIEKLFTKMPRIQEVEFVTDRGGTSELRAGLHATGRGALKGKAWVNDVYEESWSERVVDETAATWFRTVKDRGCAGWVNSGDDDGGITRTYCVPIALPSIQGEAPSINTGMKLVLKARASEIAEKACSLCEVACTQLYLTDVMGGSGKTVCYRCYAFNVLPPSCQRADFKLTKSRLYSEWESRHRKEQRLSYGQSVQLIHVKSGNFLAVDLHNQARTKRIFNVHLEVLKDEPDPYMEGSKSTYFTVLPAVNGRSFGDVVKQNDSVVLRSTRWEWDLHVPRVIGGGGGDDDDDDAGSAELQIGVKTNVTTSVSKLNPELCWKLVPFENKMPREERQLLTEMREAAMDPIDEEASGTNLKVVGLFDAFDLPYMRNGDLIRLTANGGATILGLNQECQYREGCFTGEWGKWKSEKETSKLQRYNASLDDANFGDHNTLEFMHQKHGRYLYSFDLLEDTGALSGLWKVEMLEHRVSDRGETLDEDPLEPSMGHPVRYDSVFRLRNAMSGRYMCVGTFHHCDDDDKEDNGKLSFPVSTVRLEDLEAHGMTEDDVIINFQMLNVGEEGDTNLVLLESEKIVFMRALPSAQFNWQSVAHFCEDGDATIEAQELLLNVADTGCGFENQCSLEDAVGPAKVDVYEQTSVYTVRQSVNLIDDFINTVTNQYEQINPWSHDMPEPGEYDEQNKNYLDYVNQFCCDNEGLFNHFRETMQDLATFLISAVHNPETNIDELVSHPSHEQPVATGLCIGWRQQLLLDNNILVRIVVAMKLPIFRLLSMFPGNDGTSNSGDDDDGDSTGEVNAIVRARTAALECFRSLATLAMLDIIDCPPAAFSILSCNNGMNDHMTFLLSTVAESAEHRLGIMRVIALMFENGRAASTLMRIEPTQLKLLLEDSWVDILNDRLQLEADYSAVLAKGGCSAEYAERMQATDRSTATSARNLMRVANAMLMFKGEFVDFSVCGLLLNMLLSLEQRVDDLREQAADRDVSRGSKTHDVKSELLEPLIDWTAIALRLVVKLTRGVMLVRAWETDSGDYAGMLSRSVYNWDQRRSEYKCVQDIPDAEVSARLANVLNLSPKMLRLDFDHLLRACTPPVDSLTFKEQRKAAKGMEHRSRASRKSCMVKAGCFDFDTGAQLVELLHNVYVRQSVSQVNLAPVCYKQKKEKSSKQGSSSLDTASRNKLRMLCDTVLKSKLVVKTGQVNVYTLAVVNLLVDIIKLEMAATASADAKDELKFDHWLRSVRESMMTILVTKQLKTQTMDNVEVSEADFEEYGRLFGMIKMACINVLSAVHNYHTSYRLRTFYQRSSKGDATHLGEDKLLMSPYELSAPRKQQNDNKRNARASKFAASGNTDMIDSDPKMRLIGLIEVEEDLEVSAAAFGVLWRYTYKRKEFTDVVDMALPLANEAEGRMANSLLSKMHLLSALLEIELGCEEVSQLDVQTLGLKLPVMLEVLGQMYEDLHFAMKRQRSKAGIWLQTLYRTLKTDKLLVAILHIPIRLSAGDDAQGDDGDDSADSNEFLYGQLRTVFCRCYDLLKLFADGNSINCNALEPSIEFFFSQFFIGIAPVRLLTALLQDNLPLCLQSVSRSILQQFLQYMSTPPVDNGDADSASPAAEDNVPIQRSPHALKFLRTIVRINGRVVVQNHPSVVKVLCESSQILGLFNRMTDPQSFQRLVDVLNSLSNSRDYDEKVYYIELVRTLAWCAPLKYVYKRGQSSASRESEESALLCQCALPVRLVLKLVSSIDCYVAKRVLLDFVRQVYGADLSIVSDAINVRLFDSIEAAVKLSGKVVNDKKELFGGSSKNRSLAYFVFLSACPFLVSVMKSPYRVHNMNGQQKRLNGVFDALLSISETLVKLGKKVTVTPTERKLNAIENLSAALATLFDPLGQGIFTVQNGVRGVTDDSDKKGKKKKDDTVQTVRTELLTVQRSMFEGVSKPEKSSGGGGGGSGKMDVEPSSIEMTSFSRKPQGGRQSKRFQRLTEIIDEDLVNMIKNERIVSSSSGSNVAGSGQLKRLYTGHFHENKDSNEDERLHHIRENVLLRMRTDTSENNEFKVLLSKNEVLLSKTSKMLASYAITGDADFNGIDDDHEGWSMNSTAASWMRDNFQIFYAGFLKLMLKLASQLDSDDEEDDDDDNDTMRVEQTAKESNQTLLDQGISKTIIGLVSRETNPHLVISALELCNTMMEEECGDYKGHEMYQKNLMDSLNVLTNERSSEFFQSLGRLLNSSLPVVSKLDAKRAELLMARSKQTADDAEDSMVLQVEERAELNKTTWELVLQALQLMKNLCEGHNLEWQNKLRTQSGGESETLLNVNLMARSAKLLNHLSGVSGPMWNVLMYWEKWYEMDAIERVMKVSQQIFVTLAEVQQGPCEGNQQVLAQNYLNDSVSSVLDAIYQAEFHKDDAVIEVESASLQDDDHSKGNVLNAFGWRRPQSARCAYCKRSMRHAEGTTCAENPEEDEDEHKSDILHRQEWNLTLCSEMVVCLLSNLEGCGKKHVPQKMMEYLRFDIIQALMELYMVREYEMMQSEGPHSPYANVAGWESQAGGGFQQWLDGIAQTFKGVWSRNKESESPYSTILIEWFKFINMIGERLGPDASLDPSYIALCESPVYRTCVRRFSSMIGQVEILRDDKVSVYMFRIPPLIMQQRNTPVFQVMQSMIINDVDRGSQLQKLMDFQSFSEEVSNELRCGGEMHADEEAEPEAWYRPTFLIQRNDFLLQKSFLWAVWLNIFNLIDNDGYGRPDWIADDETGDKVFTLLLNWSRTLMGIIAILRFISYLGASLTYERYKYEHREKEEDSDIRDPAKLNQEPEMLPTSTLGFWWYFSSSARTIYEVSFVVSVFVGYKYPLMHSFMMLDIVSRVHLLKVVMKAMFDKLPTFTVMSIFWGVLLLNFSAIYFHLALKEKADEQLVAEVCSTKWQCFLFMMTTGMWNTTGDAIDLPEDQNDLYYLRVFVDLLFFMVIPVVVFSIVSGIIIDAFGDSRGEMQDTEDDQSNNCFICGIERSKFENDWQQHYKFQHNMWDYIYFIALLDMKDEEEYTGEEQYVAQEIAKKKVTWMPMGRALYCERLGIDVEEDE